MIGIIQSLHRKMITDKRRRGNNFDGDAIIKTECALIRHEFFGGNISISEDVDWCAVYKEMRAQTVYMLPLSWLEQHPLDDEKLQTEWKYTALRDQTIGERLLQVQEELFQLLDAHEIEAVVLKGSAAGVAYPHPQLRLKGDIDILVKEDRFEEVARFLEENGYIRPDDGICHHMHFKKDSVLIELHRSLSTGAVSLDRDYLHALLMRGLENRIVSAENGHTFFMLPALENGVVLLMHMIQHLQSGLGLRQVADWMMYVYRNVDDRFWEEAFRPMMDRLGTTAFACTVTHMCQIYLGLPETIIWCQQAEDDVCEKLFAYICDQGNFGRKLGQKDHEVRFLSDAHTPAAIMKRLQAGGLVHWRFAGEHRILRPFAWVYQCGRVGRILLSQRKLTKIRSDYQVAKERILLFKEIGMPGK